MTVRFRLIISDWTTVQSHVSYILIAQLLYKNSERREQQQRRKTVTFQLWHCRVESYFMHKSRVIIYKTGALPQRRQHDTRMNIVAYRNEKSLPTTSHELSPEGLI